MCQLFLAELMYSKSIAKDSRPSGDGTQAGVFDYRTKPIAGAFSMQCLKIVACDISCAVDDIHYRNMTLVLWATAISPFYYRLQLSQSRLFPEDVNYACLESFCEPNVLSETRHR